MKFVVQDILYTVLWTYTILLFFSIMISWVKIFARDWYPRGNVAIIVELLLIACDPPLNLIRKIIKPANVGRMPFDFAPFVLLVLLNIGLWLTMPTAIAA